MIITIDDDGVTCSSDPRKEGTWNGIATTQQSGHRKDEDDCNTFLIVHPKWNNVVIYIALQPCKTTTQLLYIHTEKTHQYIEIQWICKVFITLFWTCKLWSSSIVCLSPSSKKPFEKNFPSRLLLTAQKDYRRSRKYRLYSNFYELRYWIGSPPFEMNEKGTKWNHVIAVAKVATARKV
jgi:hypothetical protein